MIEFKPFVSSGSAYFDYLISGHDYKGAKSMVENYCVKCLHHVSNDEGVWTDDGNECDSCSGYFIK